MKINQIITESIDTRMMAKEVLSHLLAHHKTVFPEYGDEFVVSKVKQAVKHHPGDIKGAVDHVIGLLRQTDDVNEAAPAFDPVAAEKEMDASAEKQAADDPDPGSKSLADKAALDAPVAAMGQID